MANLGGLLNVFGDVPSYASGLLSEEELDMAKARARSNALLQMGKAFYEAGAPRETPGGSTLSGVANALLSGKQAYQGAVKGSIEEKLNQQKVQQALDAQKRTKEAQRLAQGIFTPATPAQPAAMIGGAPYGMDKPAQPSGINQEVVQQLMAFPEGRAALQEIMGARKAMQPEMFSVGEGATQYSIDPFTSAVTAVAAGAPKMSDLERQYAFAKTPQGGSYAGTFEQFKAISAPKTTNIVNPLQPDKGVVKDLQGVLLNAGDRRMRYNQIDATFDPKFLTVPYRAGQEWASLKEKFVELPQDQKAELQQFASWKQNSVNNLSLTIKELTGAAMGVEEAKRIIAGLPNPGTGLTDGDSPTEFKTKLDQTVQQMKLVEARTTYLLKNGLSLNDVPLEKMPSIINQRGKQIATQYKLDPNKPRDLELIKKQLSAEFGISTQ